MPGGSGSGGEGGAGGALGGGDGGGGASGGGGEGGEGGVKMGKVACSVRAVGRGTSSCLLSSTTFPVGW